MRLLKETPEYMTEIVKVCNDYLEEKTDDRQFMRDLVEALNKSQAYVEVAEAILDGWDIRSTAP